MNMLAYEADTAWNRGIPCIFFKTLIQLYLLCSFLYSLTYCIKEVIKGNILLRLDEKYASLRQLQPQTRESLAILSKYRSYCFCFIYFLFFAYFIKEGIKHNIFGDELKKCWPLTQLRTETGESLAKY